MSNTRDDLDELMAAGHEAPNDYFEGEEIAATANALAYALGHALAEIDALKPRVITTAAELDAEPDATVVISEQGGIWEACEIGGVRYYLEPGDKEACGAASIAFPVTIIYAPEAIA